MHEAYNNNIGGGTHLHTRPPSPVPHPGRPMCTDAGVRPAPSGTAGRASPISPACNHNNNNDDDDASVDCQSISQGMRPLIIIMILASSPRLSVSPSPSSPPAFLPQPASRASRASPSSVAEPRVPPREWTRREEEGAGRVPPPEWTGRGGARRGEARRGREFPPKLRRRPEFPPKPFRPGVAAAARVPSSGGSGGTHISSGHCLPCRVADGSPAPASVLPVPQLAERTSGALGPPESLQLPLQLPLPPRRNSPSNAQVWSVPVAQSRRAVRPLPRSTAARLAPISFGSSPRESVPPFPSSPSVPQPLRVAGAASFRQRQLPRGTAARPTCSAAPQ